MKSNIHKDGETPRKQTLENANSGEVRGFQRTTRERENEKIWQNGYNMGRQLALEEVPQMIIQMLQRRYPHINFEPNENPDAGMEERERELAEAMEGKQCLKE